MKVMVLGATGFIGPPLVRSLSEAGHEVVAVSRHAAAFGPGVEALGLDRGDPGSIARALQACGAESVVDLLAMTLEATEPLLNALTGRVNRYVLASSGDVYRRYGALNRLETDADPGARKLAEDAPLRTVLYPYRISPRRPVDDPAGWMDDYDKIPIEQAATARADLHAVIARLPMVWGPGDRQQRFAWAIQPMLKGAVSLEVDEAWAAWRSTYGYIDDVAHALALCATHPAARGAYNLGAAEAPDHAHWVERFAAATGWTGALIRRPRTDAPKPLRERLDAMDLSLPMVTATSKIRAELDFVEPTEVAEALERTVAGEAARATS